MDDPLIVRGGKALRELLQVIHGFAHGHRSSFEPAAQRFSLQQFADEIRSVFVRPYIEDGKNIGMVECAYGAHLLLKAAEAIWVCRKRNRQHFDCDLAPDARVVRLVDLAHATGTYRRNNFVGPELGYLRESHWEWTAIITAGSVFVTQRFPPLAHKDASSFVIIFLA